jgi:glycogen(starch) synthase
MKILVLSYLYPPDVQGGYELGCKQAVDGLRNLGHDVRVVTSTPRTPVTTEPHVHRRFHLTDLWYNATRPNSHPAVNQVWDADAYWFSSHNVHSLIQEIDEFEPDVVYVWMLNGIGGLGLMGCLQYLKVPWVWHLMDEVPAMLCSNDWKVVPGLARGFNRYVSGHYLACSLDLTLRLRAKGIELGGEVEIVPNWVVGDRPEPRADFYRSGRLRVVSAGRITRDKGIDLLVEAARLLRERGVDNFEIDIYGPVVDRTIPNLSRQYGLDDHVHFLGSRPQAEMTALFAEYDLFAFPTETREPFGFAPLEAAARGCVPLVTRGCGIAEWLVHGVHGFKASRRAGNFANAIEAIAVGRVDLAPIGRRVQAVVWRDFHLDAVLPRIERALQRVSMQPRVGAGTTDDAYRMAVIAERLSHAIVQEPFCA